MGNLLCKLCNMREQKMKVLEIKSQEDFDRILASFEDSLYDDEYQYYNGSDIIR